ncbi:MAG TPA: trigger factor, partial [Clostridiaceae bacterium]|nr:trigger factor [Clostridiaceae bacterium]
FAIPGFRKGKAPIGMVKRYYGEAVLYDDAIDDCINPAYSEAIEEHGLEPVSRPELDIQEIGSDKGLKATITVINKPDVQLGEYKGVEAVKPLREVSDDEVEAELKRIQERNSRMIPVDDRPAKEGDTVNINYEGLKDGVPFDGGTAEDHDLKLGSDSFIPGFEDQLIGTNPGDEVDVELSFPEDYHAADLAGQPVVFKVRVNSIKEEEMPELDDEFAKDVSEFDTLDEYRDDLRRSLEERAESMADNAFEQNVILAVTDNASIDLPDVMIDNEVDQMYSQQANQMMGMGLSMEDYLGYLNQTEEEFKGQLRSDAESRVRTSLVLEAIASVENFPVTDEDREAELARMAEQYNMEIDRLKDIFGGENAMLDNDIRLKKAIKLIKDEAKPIAPPADDAAKNETDSVSETEDTSVN